MTANTSKEAHHLFEQARSFGNKHILSCLRAIQFSNFGGLLTKFIYKNDIIAVCYPWSASGIGGMYLR